MAVIDTIRHIRHNKFANSLESAVNIFNQQQSGRPYCVVWDYDVNKSRRWSFELSAPLIEQLPEAGIYSRIRLDLVVPWLIEESIFDLTFFDDAGFGGSQITGCIEKLRDEYGRHGHVPNITLVVPYTSQRARKDWTSIEGVDVNLITVEYIPTVNEILTSDQLQTLEKLQNVEGTDWHYYGFEKHSTFFDHNLPDMRSFCARLEDFVNRDTLKKPYHTFPYSEAEEKTYTNFRDASHI